MYRKIDGKTGSVLWTVYFCKHSHGRCHLKLLRASFMGLILPYVLIEYYLYASMYYSVQIRLLPTIQKRHKSDYFDTQLWSNVHLS